MVSVTEKVLPKKYANKSRFCEIITLSLAEQTVINNAKYVFPRVLKKKIGNVCYSNNNY